MSEESKREREATLKVIREEANDELSKTIENCNKIAMALDIGKTSLPNIIITYHNKIIAIEKDFSKAGIDYYDRLQCESRFIIEQWLNVIIIQSMTCLEKFISKTRIPKEQIEEFCDSYKKPTFFQKVFKGAKYEPKKSLMTPTQKEDAMSYLNEYKECSKKIEHFSIQNDMIEAILAGRILSTSNGFLDFDERISKIDMELQQLGYESISDIVKSQIDTQDLSLSNITNLTSVCIPIKKQ